MKGTVWESCGSETQNQGLLRTALQRLPASADGVSVPSPGLLLHSSSYLEFLRAKARLPSAVLRGEEPQILHWTLGEQHGTLRGPEPHRQMTTQSARRSHGDGSFPKWVRKPGAPVREQCGQRLLGERHINTVLSCPWFIHL